jgi:hypothetical protein
MPNNIVRIDCKTEGPWTSVTNQWGDMGNKLTVKKGHVPIICSRQ